MNTEHHVNAVDKLKTLKNEDLHIFLLELRKKYEAAPELFNAENGSSLNIISNYPYYSKIEKNGFKYLQNLQYVVDFFKTYDDFIQHYENL